MFKPKYRIRKVSPFTKLGDNPFDVSIYYLTKWKNGLRVTLTRNRVDGDVTFILVKGDTSKEGKFKIYRNTLLSIPSEHHIDMMVRIFVDYANSIKGRI